MGEYPTISDAQAKGIKAETILRMLLPPPSWLVQKVEHDFGIDFRVELAKEGKLRGCEFYVQVKGYDGDTSSKRTRDVSLRVSTARYWQGKLLPVLLAVINVESRQGNFVWFDKGMNLPTDQEKFIIHVPLDQNLLLEYNVLESLAPFWEPWVDQIHNVSIAAVYRKLLGDTLTAMDAVLATYDTLLFVPPGLVEQPEAVDEFREKAVHLCYLVIARWAHGVELYTATGLGTTEIDYQLRSILARSRHALEQVISPVSELPGWNLALMNPTRAVPMLNVFRRVFFEIVDFLARRLASSAGETSSPLSTNNARI